VGVGSFSVFWEFQGAPRKKKPGSDVHLLRRLKKWLLALFYFYFYFLSICFNALLGRFVTRGVKKHGKNLFSKNPFGLITKCGFFFPTSLGCLDRFFFIAFLGVS
jgi:hypothetical protein